MISVEVYTDDSLIDLQSGTFFRLGDLPRRILLKKYRRQKKKSSENRDHKFITYVESKLQKLYNEAKTSGAYHIVDSIASLGFTLKEKTGRELYDEIYNKRVYISKKAAKAALRDIRATDQEHKNPFVHTNVICVIGGTLPLCHLRSGRR